MPSLAEMIEDDLSLMDGHEAVIVRDRAGAWEFPVSLIPRLLSVREAAKSDGAYRMGDVRLHAQANALSIPAKPGDIATRADGSVYTILSVDTATLGTRFAMVTRRCVIEGATVVEAELYRLSDRKDSMGAVVLDHVPSGVSYTAQMQPMDVGSIEVADDERERPARVWRLYLPSMPSLGVNDAFRIGGTFYRWSASADSDRIDMLPNVELVELPL
ncbi:MAG: hypothetical protein KF805_12470 [Phycisphaeraceae bacterium]|nr:hypothetical protein [Phycisphaeraceae bacterium]